MSEQQQQTAVRVTGEQVKQAMIAANIVKVDHHECGGCDYMVFYSRADEQLFFNPACNCTSYYSPARPVSWDDAADWINMQSDPEWRSKLAGRFGITL